ncbi:MAG: hypothetical protein PHS51_05740 [Gallionella sp.]|nr:hypothetical protein [Gallionella sp.]
MRLTTAQIQTIQRAACQFFGADAAVWLFGSRTDDRKKAGIMTFWWKPRWTPPTR